MPDRLKQTFGLAILIVGIALCFFGFSLLLKPAQYAATARIKVETDGGIIGLSGVPASSYDPYFIQTTLEIIQSELVLDDVITNLNLNEVWGRKYFGGKTFKTSDALAIIKSQMKLALVRNTKFVNITFYSDDPNEATEVANAIAKAYGDYRIAKDKEMTKAGLAVLQQQFQQEENEISILQTNLELLRRKLNVTNDVPSAQMARQIQEQKGEAVSALPGQPYWEEKQKFDQMIDVHKLLGSKIASLKVDLQTPQTSLVQIVDIATPPISPAGPSRSLGAVLLALGLALTATGIFLLKPQEKSF